ncbi:MAG: restriction endonuclease subunit S [Prevotella sp.]|nr:restriction endonuclease subunit S [Prevotella sp.]
MEKDKENKILNVPALRFPEFTDEWESVLLEDVAEFQKKRISSDLLNNSNYISTENILQNFGGLQNSISIPANTNVIEYQKGDVLLSNIRPYLKKVWLSDRHGGCSADVFVLRGNQCERRFLYYVIASDRFINFVMSGTKGVKMPRGDKSQMEKFAFFIPTNVEQKKIARFLSMLDERIRLQNKIIEKLETLIKGIRYNIFKQLRKNVGFNATIGNILSFEQPQRYIVSSAEYSNDCTFTPVLTANKAFILGYTTETDGIYSKGDCIIIDDFTLDCKYVSFPFKVKSSAIKILTAKNKFILRYTYEYLKSLELSTEEHKRHYIADVQPHSCVLPDENTLKTIALVFENLACKLANEQSLVLILNKQKQYLLSKMFI